MTYLVFFYLRCRSYDYFERLLVKLRGDKNIIKHLKDRETETCVREFDYACWGCRAYRELLMDYTLIKNFFRILEATWEFNHCGTWVSVLLHNTLIFTMNFCNPKIPLVYDVCSTHGSPNYMTNERFLQNIGQVIVFLDLIGCSVRHYQFAKFSELVSNLNCRPPQIFFRFYIFNCQCFLGVLVFCG